VYFADLTLGSDHLPHDTAKSSSDLTKRIEEFVRPKQVDVFFDSHEIERLLLTDESASQASFIQADEDALSTTQASRPWLGRLDQEKQSLSEQVLYATSMGAAEFVKRRQEEMGKCKLPVSCPGRVGGGMESYEHEL
jgi:hypothetical protein